MRFVDEYRAPAPALALADEIRALVTRPWTVMEICGGQTHAIARYGLEDLLPEAVTLVHGPGCPVCVTPLETIERALQLALLPDVILCSFGDMLRVPGVSGDLLSVRARGADVRVVLSPIDAVRLAVDHPDRQVVLFAVGFETTAPTTAMAAELARLQGLDNFSLLASHVRVPPAMELILGAPDNRVQAFLAAGHVCTITGTEEYPALALEYRAPIVVTGFEPIDILRGLYQALSQLEAGEHRVDNCYQRSVQDVGNPRARATTRRVFEIADRPWRGLGVVADGGLRVREEYRDHDAERRFSLPVIDAPEPEACRAAEVLMGLLKPPECPAFGSECRPESPLGAPMVSSEGACAAYYQHRRHRGHMTRTGTR